jgi:hypothetical protein
VALAGVAGPLRLCRWWFRPIRCAWRSFVVLVVALAGVAGPLRVGGWLVVQAHSVRMGLLRCAGCGPGRRGGAVAVGGWWFRPIRCAWRSFLVLVLMADGWWSRPFGAHGAPSLCCWVALAGVAGPLRMVVDGSGPLGAHVRLLAAQRPWEGPVGGTIYTVSSPFGTHDAPS